MRWWPLAAAWDTNDLQTITCRNALLDLSLLRLVDAVTLQLHPLLADYAQDLAGDLTPAELISAHVRVADALFLAAPRPPRTWSDMKYVLRAHYHAAMAGDPARASRVYPWFSDSSINVAVPAFLLDRGRHHTHVFHERLQLQLAADSSAWTRSFAFYRLGAALQGAGELDEAEERLQHAVDLMDGPDVDDDGRAIGLSKFLMALGQVQADLGKLDEAEASYLHAIEFDRRIDAAGGVSGAKQGALIGLLQLADLFAQAQRPDGADKSARICSDVYTEAAEHGEAQVAVMALSRLVRHLQQADPEQALELVRLAAQIGEFYPQAFAERQGARYARFLAESARELAFNGLPALDDALALFCRAIGSAGRCDARQELGHALYQLGNLFEHYFLLDRDAPLVAAWACYALAESYTRENERGSPLNAQYRIDQRIVPRIEAPQRAAAAAAVAADPWSQIDAALAPHALGWRPAP